MEIIHEKRREEYDFRVELLWLLGLFRPSGIILTKMMYKKTRPGATTQRSINLLSLLQEWLPNLQLKRWTKRTLVEAFDPMIKVKEPIWPAGASLDGRPQWWTLHNYVLYCKTIQLRNKTYQKELYKNELTLAKGERYAQRQHDPKGDAHLKKWWESRNENKTNFCQIGWGGGPPQHALGSGRPVVISLLYRLFTQTLFPKCRFFSHSKNSSYMGLLNGIGVEDFVIGKRSCYKNCDLPDYLFEFVLWSQHGSHSSGIL